MDAVEEAVIEALLAMVVRLSEAAFRPMFYKVRKCSFISPRGLYFHIFHPKVGWVGVFMWVGGCVRAWEDLCFVTMYP